MSELKIWTDGGSRGNPGLGAWAFYCPQFSMRSYGSDPNTTNNKMELTAILNALKWVLSLDQQEYDTVVIHSDSQYSVSTLTTWVWDWIKNGTFNTKKNVEIISSILLVRKLLVLDEWSVKFIKVPGHSNDEGNNEADRLVNYSMDTGEKFITEISMDHLASIIHRLDYLYKIDGLYYDKDTKSFYIEASGWSSTPKGNQLYDAAKTLCNLYGYGLEISGYSSSNLARKKY